MTSTVHQDRTTPHRAVVIVIWVLRVVLAALFLAASMAKLTSQPMMVAEFHTVGIGQWFRYFTGVLELTGAVLTVIPRTSPFGALALLTVDLGAFVAQLSVLHIDWVHPIVIGALLVALVWLQRERLTLPSRSAPST
jgi:putative oxidoreductase